MVCEQEKDSTKSGDKGSGDAQEKDHSSDRHRSKDRSKDHSKDRGDRDKRDSEVISVEKEDRKVFCRICLKVHKFEF